MLTQDQTDHISSVTNARGVQFAQAGLGPDPYSFVAAALNGQLSISVKRERTGTVFEEKTRARGGLTDAEINEVLTAIERRLQLKPAE